MLKGPSWRGFRCAHWPDLGGFELQIEAPITRGRAGPDAENKLVPIYTVQYDDMLDMII